MYCLAENILPSEMEEVLGNIQKSDTDQREVRLDRGETNTVKIGRGVRQRCIPSTFFSLESISSELEQYRNFVIFIRYIFSKYRGNDKPNKSDL